jgi:hypothetical protein
MLRYVLLRFFHLHAVCEQHAALTKTTFLYSKGTASGPHAKSNMYRKKDLFGYLTSYSSNNIIFSLFRSSYIFFKNIHTVAGHRTEKCTRML